MTIKTHIETMRELLLGLEMHWATTEGNIKASWLSMVARLAGELETVALAESSVLEPVRHGDQAQSYLDRQKMKGKYGTDTSLPI
jgi:hypothetical protein